MSSIPISMDETIPGDRQAILEAYVARQTHRKVSAAPSPAFAPPELLDDEHRAKPMKSDYMTAAISADPSPGVVLQALLADDLMAFTEFAFGVVRPGILFKPNWSHPSCPRSPKVSSGV